MGPRKPAAPPRRQGPAERGVVSADAGEIEARADGEGDDGDGGEAKYARRPRSMRRSLQRAFPALFPASLPLTARRAPPRGARGPARSGRCLRAAGAAARLRVAAPGVRAPQRRPDVRACAWASAQPPAAICLTQAWLQVDPGPGGLRWVRIARCPISPAWGTPSSWEPARRRTPEPLTRRRDVRDGGEAGKRGGGEGRPARRRRRGRSLLDARNVLAAVVTLAFLGFLVLLYARVAPRLP